MTDVAHIGRTFGEIIAAKAEFFIELIKGIGKVYIHFRIVDHIFIERFIVNHLYRGLMSRCDILRHLLDIRQHFIFQIIDSQGPNRRLEDSPIGYNIRRRPAIGDDSADDMALSQRLFVFLEAAIEIN